MKKKILLMTLILFLFTFTFIKESGIFYKYNIFRLLYLKCAVNIFKLEKTDFELKIIESRDWNI